jgi:hypothetical protein
MGNKRKPRRKANKAGTRPARRKARYSPFEIFMAVLGAAILVFVVVLIVGAVLGP